MERAGANNMGFVLMLKEMMTSVWDERKVPKEWVNAILIPADRQDQCMQTHTHTHIVCPLPFRSRDPPPRSKQDW